MDEVLRIILFQSSANYKREETVENKMTYPLPPFSTIIGALHNACNYKEYHPMELSIQGQYESMIKKAYIDYCFLNVLENDRGILVKMRNESMLSTAFEKVAIAKEKQNNNFRKGITIEEIDKKLLKEYRDLKDINEAIGKFKKERFNPALIHIKARKKSLAEKNRGLEKSSLEFKRVENREKEIKQIENEINQRMKEYEEKNYKIPISKFRTLTTSLKYYEILTNIELVIHIRSDRETLECIKEHIYDLKSIGRSEDFVQVRDVRFVKLLESIDTTVENPYAAYVDYELLKNYDIISKIRQGTKADGTKYYLNKKYEIVGNKRIFEKKKVVYLSHFTAEEDSENVYFDIMDDEKTVIVNFM